MHMDEGLRDQGFTRLTYELDEFDGVTRLTLTHDCTGAPGHAAMIEGAADERPDAGGGGGRGAGGATRAGAVGRGRSATSGRCARRARPPPAPADAGPVGSGVRPAGPAGA